MSLAEGPLVLELGPGDKLPSSSCAVAVFGKLGQGVGVHIEQVELPRVGGRCAAWLQLESEHESTLGGWKRSKSYSDRVCGNMRPRSLFLDSEPCTI